MKHLSVFKPTVRLLGAAIHDELTLSDWAKIRWEHRVELERDGVRDIEKKQEMEFYIWFSKRVSQLQKEGSVGVTEDLKNLSNGLEKLVTRYTGCVINGIRNDMDLIDVDVNIEDQNDAIDNSMDDDNVTDDVSFNYEGNEEDCISFNDESDCEEDYISSNNESDDT
ncbi:hypothetical protein JRO89_XS05G0181700 [Xanthoceras sorbifolium]|uniref:Uncharacterized protein n=1 Tax=Xanthoceras sorbifolium TaxID=99658 RepID=A0ABQ8I2C0_9ROSI|nr:hypothetical protein JRO89_XS05G0181700 [Xanthoceras sorbifolium]